MAAVSASASASPGGLWGVRLGAGGGGWGAPIGRLARECGLAVVGAAAGSGAIGSFRDASPDTLAGIMDVDFIAPAELVRQFTG